MVVATKKQINTALAEQIKQAAEKHAPVIDQQIALIVHEENSGDHKVLWITTTPKGEVGVTTARRNAKLYDAYEAISKQLALKVLLDPSTGTSKKAFDLKKSIFSKITLNESAVVTYKFAVVKKDQALPE